MVQYRATICGEYTSLFPSLTPELRQEAVQLLESTRGLERDLVAIEKKYVAELGRFRVILDSVESDKYAHLLPLRNSTGQKKGSD